MFLQQGKPRVRMNVHRQALGMTSIEQEPSFSRQLQTCPKRRQPSLRARLYSARSNVTRVDPVHFAYANR